MRQQRGVDLVTEIVPIGGSDLPFPTSLPEFMRLFPDDAACAAYLEGIRWPGGFVCPWCRVAGLPYRFAKKPGVLRCRACKKDVGLTAGTVMERSHTPLSTWFWAAYLVSSLTPGMSAVQFRSLLGIGGGAESPTYADLYSGEWQHPGSPSDGGHG
jgi:hypothetical protein